MGATRPMGAKRDKQGRVHTMHKKRNFGKSKIREPTQRGLADFHFSLVLIGVLLAISLVCALSKFFK
jgi:hypothetical protein